MLLDGSWSVVAYAVATTLMAALLMAPGLQGPARGARHATATRVLLIVGAIVAGGSTIWFGRQSPVNLVVLVAGVALLLVARNLRRSDSAQPG